MLVRYGLKGWKGFLDSNDKEVLFLTQSENFGGRAYLVPNDKTINLLPYDLISELAIEISGDNELSEDDEKN
jgi:hypothetical protein